jgi:hypothetical protein
MRPVSKTSEKRTKALSLAFAVAIAACGGGAAREPGAPSAASANSAAPAEQADAGVGGADAAPAGRPFAGSPAEATQLIGGAIDEHASEMKKCVAEYRTRKKMPHERVEISVGIDQEGRLLGASVKGRKPDAPLSECLQLALASAPFPRSRAGVIQVTKSYEEIEQ